MKSWLTTTEAARFLDVTPNTLYRWLKDGTIPVRRIGGRWRFYREDLERWVLANSFGPSISSPATTEA